ncbi:MAG: Holliday junction resolvase RuvX [Clostridiales Family XIII bacterium]|jgi:putative Holliday junction resolvase|nr:Holliday junction resolvase RuvX [Clostridiales Family XIII bacterium]
MKIMGIDVGDKTIGIAVSDPLEITAQGITTLERVGIRKDAGAVIVLAEAHGCERIVVGLPLKLDGTYSIQTDKVAAFKTMLENKLRGTGKKIELIFHDERFTTVIAKRVLIEADLSRKKQKSVIDKQAAVVILQSYLDGASAKRGALE